MSANQQPIAVLGDWAPTNRESPANHFQSPPGATYLGDNQCLFRVWSPTAKQIELLIDDRTALLEPDAWGYHTATIDDVPPGTRYRYRIDDGDERPDPASRSQPEGVHAPSAVVDPAFAWRDQQWTGIPLRDYVVYEMHVGTFTPKGTFDAVIPHLPMLKELGVTALELLPVAQFPGERNWGYDGVYLYAPQHSYGGPAGLRRLVNACHEQGIAVVLDVVYNHFGPEGNYISQFGPYFTDHYNTPWGAAVNFDGPQSDGVRHFFIANALYWLREFHIDALRLDAVHAIYDFGAYHVLNELADAAHNQAEQLNRRAYLIAESDLNDSRLIRPALAGGYNLDAQWSDDFHHALHALLTTERDGYYVDFGAIQHLARVLRLGYTYAGDYSGHRQRRHGNEPDGCAGQQFVVCAQNHDQIGNRAFGERLSGLLSFDQLKLAAGVLLLAPFVPMLFMGEEYGEPAPFQYFTDHSDPALVKAVREGRQREFSAFAWQGEVPAPDDVATFERSKLNLDARNEGKHKALWELHQELLRMRRDVPALADLDQTKQQIQVHEAERVMVVQRWSSASDILVCYNFGDESANVEIATPIGEWHTLLDTATPYWRDPADASDKTVQPDGFASNGTHTLSLAANSVVVFERG